jgi:hypothetical protein
MANGHEMAETEPTAEEWTRFVEEALTDQCDLQALFGTALKVASPDVVKEPVAMGEELYGPKEE